MPPEGYALNEDGCRNLLQLFGRCTGTSHFMWTYITLLDSVKLSNGQLVVNPGSVGLPAYYDDEPILT